MATVGPVTTTPIKHASTPIDCDDDSGWVDITSKEVAAAEQTELDRRSARISNLVLSLGFAAATTFLPVRVGALCILPIAALKVATEQYFCPSQKS